METRHAEACLLVCLIEVEDLQVGLLRLLPNRIALVRLGEQQPDLDAIRDELPRSFSRAQRFAATPAL